MSGEKIGGSEATTALYPTYDSLGLPIDLGPIGHEDDYLGEETLASLRERAARQSSLSQPVSEDIK